jgi:type I restriction enzyme S subunit
MTMIGKAGYRETSIGWIPTEWEALTLGECAIVTMGQSPDGTTYNSSGIGTPLLNGPTEFTNKYPIKIQWTSAPTKICQSGDILICVRGSSTGRMNISNDEYCIGRGLASIRYRDGFSQNFLVQLLHFSVDGILKYSAGTTFPSIDKTVISSIHVPTPPILEQQKIAAILTAVDDKLDVIARQIATTQTLKQGLMQTLFSRGVGTRDANGLWVPHTEFKDCELGEIPVTWQILSLEKFCNGALKTGPFGSQLHAAEYQDEGVSVIMPKDLINCRVNKERAAKITPERAETLAKHKLVKGDILFSRRGDVARFALIDEASEGSLCGTGCLKAKPSKEHSSEYLSHLLQLDSVKEWLEQNAVGQTMPNMNTSILASLPLVAPPSLAEEEEIAGILDSLDAKLNILSSKQTHYQTLKLGLMQKLLTGEWRVKIDAVTGGASMNLNELDALRLSDILNLVSIN